MATYSSNTTIKIGQSVILYANLNGPASQSDSFTVPSNSYLIVTLSEYSAGTPFGGSASASVMVTYPGVPAQSLDIKSNFEYVSDGTPPGQVGTNPLALMLPSGSVINASAIANNVLTTATYRVVGQLFQNTP